MKDNFDIILKIKSTWSPSNRLIVHNTGNALSENQNLQQNKSTKNPKIFHRLKTIVLRKKIEKLKQLYFGKKNLKCFGSAITRNITTGINKKEKNFKRGIL